MRSTLNQPTAVVSNTTNASPARGPDEHGGEHGHRTSVWQSPFVQNVLPLLSSLGFHAVVIALAVVAARVIISTVASPSQLREEVQVGKAEAELRNNLPEGMPTMGPPLDPTRNIAQDNDVDVSRTLGIADHKGLSLAMSKAGGGIGENEASTDLIGTGRAGGSGNGLAFGMGNKVGTGSGDDGPLSQFGHPGGGGGGLKPGDGMFGSRHGVKRVAFVCDASGSMISKMASLKEELSKAVNALRPYQSYNIIFFKDVKFDALHESALERATPDAKRAGFLFLDNITPTGTTDPLPALDLAFRQKPELIWLLTDGDFKDNASVHKRINELNHDHAVRINTIAFVNELDIETDFLDLLQKIAKENNGEFKHVKESDLNQ